MDIDNTPDEDLDTADLIEKRIREVLISYGKSSDYIQPSTALSYAETLKTLNSSG